MPAIVGAVQVINIGSGGVFHIGDVFKISPRSNTKTFAGAGSFNTGENLSLYNNQSTTSTYDANLVDQPIGLTL
ncbi:spore germination protein [Bacillus sp. V5-8f]|uniref:spore germination protein n=1 Tax=Bacillus sp. V5-8f TaxID=2053044 RepID=UPI000C78617C|nr:spore germination protein [Bacillus sp. V5-8f]PLT33831.1 spore gernimation protein GerPA [Bacillus sp. V5-8f]